MNDESKPMTDERLAEIEQRWITGEPGPDIHLAHSSGFANDLGELLAEIRRLRADRESEDEKGEKLLEQFVEYKRELAEAREAIRWADDRRNDVKHEIDFLEWDFMPAVRAAREQGDG
jgi:chromosome segregation ATPase